MRLLRFVFLLPVLKVPEVAALTLPTSPLGPVVDLGYAAFAGNSTSPSGIINSNVTFFGGIPYAEPPLGNLRWRAPKMLDENAVAGTVTDARNWGPPCIQTPAMVGIGSEDCLTLNIWKPTSASAEDKLPVAVYIHVCVYLWMVGCILIIVQWYREEVSMLVCVIISSSALLSANHRESYSKSIVSSRFSPLRLGISTSNRTHWRIHHLPTWDAWLFRWA